MPAAAPYDFAVTTGARVAVFTVKTARRKSRSIDGVVKPFSGVIRGTDGNLIAAGNDSGTVRVFNMQGSGASLRNMKGHTRAAKVIRWGACGTRILSASDDKTAKWWDLSTGEAVVTFKGHSDYVRCAAVGSPSTICYTGSYDHYVRLWDTREASKAALSFDHGAPVDAILPPKRSLVMSSGSNQIKVWDTIKGGDPIATFSNSQKTITTLCQDATGTRVLFGLSRRPCQGL